MYRIQNKKKLNGCVDFFFLLQVRRFGIVQLRINRMPNAGGESCKRFSLSCIVSVLENAHFRSNTEWLASFSAVWPVALESNTARARANAHRETTRVRIAARCGELAHTFHPSLSLSLFYPLGTQSRAR